MQAEAILHRPTAGIVWMDDAPLDSLNTMGLPAVARSLALVSDARGLRQFLRWAAANGEPFEILGGGSNVILADAYYEQTFLQLGGDFTLSSVRGEAVFAGAAAPLVRLVSQSCKAGLSGLEGAWGIPGTLGGAIRGNAGTREWSMSQSVAWVEVFDRSGKMRRLQAGEIRFGYRNSSLGDVVIARARLDLKREPAEVIERNLAAAKSRRTRQPGKRSAGCIFKNPAGDFAGRLIEAAGLKGCRCGGAVVSPDHANFIVNEGGATGRDVVNLIDIIQRRVQETFNIRLDVEVHILHSTSSRCS
ncbi:MAG: UDP-N-acetylmuramate dehydrogenase [Candidatus Sumerlaeia bacterium]|nr:UDP-N-acetylmuramate dehydrogenase [Candidatus Sumerlaeia bacterium]